VAQLWKEKTRTLGYGISNMDYESIFNKLNDISIHGNYSLLASGENNLSCAKDEEQPCHEIKKTTCDACGAHLPINNVNNNGVCKCEYCDTFHYIW
jgi:hypothetical protein